MRKYGIILLLLAWIHCCLGKVVLTDCMVPETIEGDAGKIQMLAFPVSAGQRYRVRARIEMEPCPEEIMAELVFFGQDGKNLSVTECELGFEPSGKTLALKSENGEFMLEISAIAGHVQAVPVKAELFLGVSGRFQACRLKVSNVLVEENPPVEGNDGMMSGSLVDVPELGVKYARNLAPNPSFELIASDGLPEGWSLGSGDATCEVLTGDSYSGKRALLIPDASGISWSSEPIPVTPGKFLQLAYRVKFSPHATPFGHKNPVTMVFLSPDGNGGFMKTTPKWQEFPYSHAVKYVMWA